MQKKVLMKQEGATPAARNKFRQNERSRWESLEENKGMESKGKLLVQGPKELLSIKPGPRGVAGTSESPHSIGRGLGRSRAKTEVSGFNHSVTATPRFGGA